MKNSNKSITFECYNDKMIGLQNLGAEEIGDILQSKDDLDYDTDSEILENGKQCAKNDLNTLYR